MGVVIKQSFWGTVITYFGVVIGYLNTLYLRPEFFSLDQIGIFTLVTANAMMISPLCSFGMNGSFIKFFPQFKDDTSLKNQVFTFQFSIVILANLFIISIAYLNQEWIVAEFSKGNSEYVNYLAITAIIVIVNSLFEHLFAFSSTILKVVFPSFIREVFLRVAAIALVLGYAWGYLDFTWAVKGLAINYTAAFILLFFQLVFAHKLRFDFSFSKMTKEWRQKILGFALYSMSLAISFAVLNNASYAQVSNILGDAANGIFVTCFFIGVIVEMPRRNMAKVISPLLSESMANNDLKEVRKIYKRSSITMSVMGFLLFIGILTNIQDLFIFIPQGDAFATGMGVVIAVCGAKMVLMVSSFAGEIINYSDYYKYNLIFQVGAALALITLNVILIPVYGLDGVALSYFLTILLHSFVKYLFVSIKFHIHPFTRTHIVLFLISAILLIGFYYFNLSVHPIYTIIIRSVLTTIIFIFLIYKFKISEDINKLIDSLISRYLKKV